MYLPANFRERPILVLSALYSLAFAPLLVMRGIYWDSWVWYRQFIYHDYARIFAEEFDTTRVPHFYALFRFVDVFSDPVFVERLIIFVSWLCSGLLLFYIVRRFFEWNIHSAFLLSAYYLVYPVYFVRFDLMIGYHSIANVCFVLGTTLLFIALKQKRWGICLELLSFPLFFLAFLVNSYPFFFGVTLAAHVYLFSRQRGMLLTVQWHTLKQVASLWLRRYFHVLALPVVFVLWRLTAFAPYGRDANYNKILIFEPSVGLFIRMLEDLWGGMYAGLLWPITSSLMLTERKFFVLAVLIAGACIWFVARPYFKNNFTFPISSLAFFVIGSSMAVLAILPYLLVGKMPHIYGNGFGLRHGLLLGLPASFLIIGTIGYVVRDSLQRYAHLLVLSISIGFIWFNLFLLDMDWYKQQSVLHDFPSILTDIPRGSVIVISDTAASYNWNRRAIGRPEYNGWLDTLAGQKAYLGVGKYNFDEGPNAAESAATSTVHVTIRSLRPLSEPVVKEWVYLKWFELTHTLPELRAEARKTLQVTIERSDL